MTLELRRAGLTDRERIQALIETSSRSLGLSAYSQVQIEAALKGAFGVDTELIRDGTYFVIESDGELVGCGGWSKREKPWGGDARSREESRLLDPACEPAKIRAFFVHPDFARQGIASRLLQHCEAEARAAGFAACELTATLSGLPFYRSARYASETPFEANLGDESITFVPMRKEL